MNAKKNVNKNASLKILVIINFTTVVFSTFDAILMLFFFHANTISFHAYKVFIKHF
jgi:hypothetical protein